MTYPALTALRALYRPSDPAFWPDATAAQRAVLAVLAMHAGEDGTCFPSISTICRGSGFKRSLVIQSLAQLEAMCTISRTRRPPRPTLYTVHLLDRPSHGPSMEKTVTVHDMDVDRPSHGPERRIERPQERPTLLDDLSVSVEDRRDFPPLATLPRKGRDRLYPPEFEGAFAALPARHLPHAKGDAYNAWRARVVEVEEMFQLEAAADAYREDCDHRGRSGTEYVMMASTFFGPGERWKPYLGMVPTLRDSPSSSRYQRLDRKAMPWNREAAA